MSRARRLCTFLPPLTGELRVSDAQVENTKLTFDRLDGLNKELNPWDTGYYGHIYNVSCHSHRMTPLVWPARKYIVQVARFDPATLEEKFARQNKGGLLPGSQKARNWDLFADYYEELVGDMDRSFQYLFGDGFVRAYEEQLQKLAIKRKAQTNDK